MGDKLLLHTFSEHYLVFKVKLEVVALCAYWRKKMMEVHKVITPRHEGVIFHRIAGVRFPQIQFCL